MLTVNNVSYSYKNGVRALKGVSLEIMRREFIGIVGENGSGKSTLGKILAGLLRPSQGFITAAAGRDFQVAYSFQNPDYQLFHSSVKDELQSGLQLRRIDKGERESLMHFYAEMFGLMDLLDLSPFELPYGTRKLITFAAAMILSPQMQILDEPTVGLDSRGLERLNSALINLKNQGTTVIIISHDVEFIVSHCGRVLWLDDGEKRFDGQTKELVRLLTTEPEGVLAIPAATKIGKAVLKRDDIFLTLDEVFGALSS